MNSNGFVTAGRFIFIFFAFISLVGLARAQTALSVNALGYVDVNCQAGSNFVTAPLLTTDNSISNLFRSVPDGSFLRIWEREIDEFGPTNFFTTASGWSDPNAVLIQPKGALLWLTASQTISFVGEVLQSTLTNQLYPPGLWVLGAMPGQGFVFCADFTQCPPQTPPDGTVFGKWNPIGKYFQYYYFVNQPPPDGGWFDGFGFPANPRLEHGEAGLFYVPSSFRMSSFTPGTPGPGGGPVNLREARYDGVNLSFRFPATGTAPYALFRRTNFQQNTWETLQEGDAIATGGWATVTVSNISGGFAFYRLGPRSATTPWPVLFNPVRESGEFRFEFYAPTNGTYVVDRSLALNYPLDWQPIRTNTAASKALVKVTDTNATAATGYYRVRQTN